MQKAQARITKWLIIKYVKNYITNHYTDLLNITRVKSIQCFAPLLLPSNNLHYILRQLTLTTL